jgi:hypothetical protein
MPIGVSRVTHLRNDYYKLLDQYKIAASMIERNFASHAEKGTTSGVEAEARTIVVGTAHNIHDAEAKTKRCGMIPPLV